jgi:amino acid adenylation domain-containing protein
MAMRSLVEYLEASAARWPDRPAVVDSAGTAITYEQLNTRANRLAGFLAARGVRTGDRVGVVVPKGIEAVISLYGIMKAGGAYVPIDFTAPAERGKQILTDCSIRALVVDKRALAVTPDDEGLRQTVLVVGAPAGEAQPIGVTFEEACSADGPAPTADRDRQNLAYILYTSGSTGIPKGVMLTHENALSFVEWCSSVFAPTERDRFSSHAPFHFDLSVLDLYVAAKHGASVHLISEELGKNPRELAKFISDRRLTIWYSTPSILTMLMQFGSLGSYDASSLRIVLFAGEVFPVKHLRAVKTIWPAPVFFNLYGPTETNVCTFARIPDLVPDDRDMPYPIGFACSHCAPLVLDDELNEVASGDEGLLYISGPSVFGGYWNRPVENETAFIERGNRRWYNTGDLVRWREGEGFVYSGRKDRMVKRRGYRIELGEIERALYKNPAIREAAVISVADPETGVRIVAFLACHGTAPSIIEMKSFCSANLPSYMSPDRFAFQNTLPKTSTDKVDYQTLKRQVLEPPVGASVA